MHQTKQTKTRKLGDLMPGRQITESEIEQLEANLREVREQMQQLRAASDKLRATIVQSKKLVADWEC